MKKIIFLVPLLFLFACNKEKKITVDSVISAKDHSTIESEFSSVFDVAEDFNSNDRRVRSGQTILPSSAVVTFQDSSFSDGDGIECTIDFGPLKTNSPKGVLCLDGRYRAGVLHLKMNKRYFQDSFECMIWAEESDAYYAGNDGFNLSSISGTMTVLKLNLSTFKITVSNAKLSNENGTITWQSSRVIDKKVDNSAGILGDEYSITGNASGVNRKGESFEVNIIEPLYKKIQMGCARTFTQGVLELINVSSQEKILLDYDPYNNNACDLIAKATIRSKEFIFTVR
jgi:hypothetical protein